MALRPGQRVLFNGRMGTVKANRPAGMVDVQFDDRKTGERRSARDLRPVRSNPRIRRNPKWSKEEMEAAEGSQQEWLEYAEELLEKRVNWLKGAMLTWGRKEVDAQALREKIDRYRDDPQYTHRERRLADPGETVLSPFERDQGRVDDLKRDASRLMEDIKGTVKGIESLATGTDPAFLTTLADFPPGKKRKKGKAFIALVKGQIKGGFPYDFSRQKAIALQKAILSVPVTVPKGEPPQRRKEKRAEQKAGVKRVKRQEAGPSRFPSLSLPDQIKQQDAAFRIVPDRPRSSPDRLSECGNPIDGKAYVLAIKSEKRTFPVWLKYSDLELLGSLGRVSGDWFHALANMTPYRQGRKELPDGLILEARSIKPGEASFVPSAQNEHYGRALPDGVRLVRLSTQWPANIRQRKKWITRSDKTMGRQQAGVSGELHPRSRLPAPGRSRPDKLEPSDAILLELPDGTVRGFVVQKGELDPFRQRLQQDFSPFPPYTAKGDNPFYSWVPEEAGELQRVLDSADPELGDAPCLTKSDKTQIQVANGAIRRVKGAFQNALSWHKFLGGDNALRYSKRARQQIEWSQTKMRDLYKLGKSIETNAPGYDLLNAAFQDGVEPVVKVVRYAAYLEKSGFISHGFDSLYQIFMDVGEDYGTQEDAVRVAKWRVSQAEDKLSNQENEAEIQKWNVEVRRAQQVLFLIKNSKQQPVAHLLRFCVEADTSLLQALMKYFGKWVERVHPKKGRPHIIGAEKYYWGQLSLDGQLKLLNNILKGPAPKPKGEKRARSAFDFLSRAESFLGKESDAALKDCAKVLVDLCVEDPAQKVPGRSAASFFWYYATLLNRPGLVGPIGKTAEKSPWVKPTALEKKAIATVEELEGKRGELVLVETGEGLRREKRGLTPLEEGKLKKAIERVAALEKRRGEAGEPESLFLPKAFEAQVRRLTIALSGGSTLSTTARKWRVYKTYNPLVFHVTKEYFRDRSGWGNWHQHPEELQEVEMIGYYGALLRVVQAAEITFAQNEGHRPENWEDISQGLVWLMEPQLTEYGMAYNPMWRLISPSDWTQENLAMALNAFITDPKGYVTSVKNSALPGFTKIGTIANRKRDVPAWTGFDPGTKKEITLEAYTHWPNVVEPLGDVTLPQGSVAYKMSQKQQMRETVLSHLNKLISTLS